MQTRSRRWVGALAGAIVIGIAGCGGGGGSSSTGGSSTGTATLSLAANSIVYGVAATSSTYSVAEMSPTGSNPTTVASAVPDTIVLFAVNPAAPSQYVMAADPTGSGTYGIYLSDNLTLKGATTLVAPAYAYVSSVTVTANGQNVVYSAAPAGGVSNLYVVPLTGGAAVQLGLSDGSTVSAADSNTIAYVAPVNNNGSLGIDQVFTRTITGGPNGAVLQLTTDGSNHLLPAFNPAGSALAFWEESGSTDTLIVDTLATSTLTPLPNPLGILAQGEAFSNDGLTLVIAGELNAAGSISTQPADGSSGPSLILNSSSLLGNYGIFWTDSNGRIAGGVGGASSAGRVRRNYRPTPAAR